MTQFQKPSLPGDAAALVADADADVVLPLGDEHVDVRQVEGAALARLHDGAHGVLEELEEDVVEVLRRVAQRHRHLVNGRVIRFGDSSDDSTFREMLMTL